MTRIPSFVKNLLKLVAYIFTAVISIFVAFFVAFVVLITLSVGLAEDDLRVSSSELQLKHHAGVVEADNKVVSIPISGIILGEREELPDFFQLLSEYGITYGYDVKDTLFQLAERDDIDGVILELHSPGGTIYGTTAIADGVDYYQEQTGKPVVAYVGSVAASGGYWVAASADEIVADNGTTIGSIGVIAGPFKYYEGVIAEDGGLLGTGITTTEGVETNYITAGRSKDLGNPYRPLTEEERTTLQTGVNNSYEKFVAYVAGERELDETTITDTIGALIYDEVQAQNNGLIDAGMTKDEAYTRLANLAGVDEVEILRPQTLDGFFSSFSTALFSGMDRTVIPGFCNDRTAVLVYSGDVSALCS